VDYRPSSSNSRRDSQMDTSPNHDRQEASSSRSARSRHVTMWGLWLGQPNRHTGQASTSSGLDKGKQLVSEGREVRGNDNSSDELQKQFNNILAGYEDFLRKLNGKEEEIKEFSSRSEKEFLEKNGEEQKQYIEELEKDFGVVKKLHEEVEGLFENNKSRNGYEAKESKEVEKELQDLRIKFLGFLKAEIENSSDKKETFHSWTRIIDGLYHDRELIKEGHYDAVGRDMAMILTPTSIIDREPGEVKAVHCKGNDQIYKLLISTCDSLYPEFKEQKLLRELRLRIFGLEGSYGRAGINVMYMNTQETARYSGLLLKEVQRCINQGEQVEELRQEVERLRGGLSKYSRFAGELDDWEQRGENLGTAWRNVYAIDGIFKKYDKQKRREMLRRIVTLGRRSQPEQRREL
jgi:hypothetical protein